GQRFAEYNGTGRGLDGLPVPLRPPPGGGGRELGAGLLARGAGAAPGEGGAAEVLRLPLQRRRPVPLRVEPPGPALLGHALPGREADRDPRTRRSPAGTLNER